MPTARRSRTVAAPPERVWEVVGDPHHLPRWWPKVTRVEAVTDDHFTEMLSTQDGRLLRADFRVVDSRAPERRAWEQELEGTPFERVFAAASTEVKLLPDGEGTRVTVVVRQQVRGSARLGGFMVRRATGRVLDEALDALEALHGP
jgi:carbon monoxide dehydrogenase subunit G